MIYTHSNRGVAWGSAKPGKRLCSVMNNVLGPRTMATLMEINLKALCETGFTMPRCNLSRWFSEKGMSSRRVVQENHLK